MIACGFIYAVGLVFPLDTTRQSAADTERIVTFFRALGLQPQDVARSIKQAQQTWPAFLVIFSALFGYIVYSLGIRVAARFGYQARERIPFRFWRVDEWLVWGFIVPLVILVLQPGLAGKIPDWLPTQALNIMMIFTVVYLLQGLSIVNFLLVQSKIWLMPRFMIYIILLIQWPLLVVLGLLDIWVDFRKKLAKIS